MTTKKQYEPPERLLARFSDDQRLLRERRVSSEGRDEGGRLLYTVVTPDRDVEQSTLAPPHFAEVARWPLGRKKVPEGVRRRECYLFENSEGGEIEDAELKNFLWEYAGKRANGTAWAEPVSGVRRRASSKGPGVILPMRDGAVYRTPGRRAEKRERKRSGPRFASR